MGNKTSLPSASVAKIHNETGFSVNQIHKLYTSFRLLDADGKGTLTKEDFFRIPELVKNPLAERVVNLFLSQSNDGRVNFNQYMRVLAHFRPIKKNKKTKLNSREEKLQYLFSMYDVDNDGRITRHELFYILQSMVRPNVTHDSLVKLAESLFSEADMNMDQTIDFKEFCHLLDKINMEQMSVNFF